MRSYPDKTAHEFILLYRGLHRQRLQPECAERLFMSELVFAAVCCKFNQPFFLTGSKSDVNRFSKTSVGKFSRIQARSSGGERYLDTVEVVGSNPIVPTMTRRDL